MTEEIKQPTDQSPQMNTEPISSSRIDTIRAVTVMIMILTGAIAIGITGLAAVNPSWQFLVLSITYTITALYGAVSYFTFLPEKRLYLVMVGMAALFAASAILSSAVLDGVGIPIAIVYLVFAMITSSALVDENSANRTIIYGLITAAICSILTVFSPYEQISNPLITVITISLLGVLFMGYVSLLAMRYVAWTMRIRMVTSFITIVILPLSILSFIQSRFTYDVLLQETNRSLLMAVEQTSSGLDRFLETTRNNVIKAATFDIYERYLALPEDQREGSPEESELRLTLRILDVEEFSNSIYLASYALLDINGVNVYDTLSDRMTSALTDEAERSINDIDAVTKGKGSLEGENDYFIIPSRTGVDYISPLLITGRNQSNFYVSTPIRNKTGEIIGVLRIRYDGLILQDVLRRYNGMMGTKSYTILLDENSIRLADTFTPNFLYRTVAPLTASQLVILQGNQRMPELPEAMISTQYKEFAEILYNSEIEPYFTTEISATQKENNLPEIGVIRKLRMMPWKVVYLIEDFDNTALRKSERQLTIAVTVTIAALVGVVAVLLSQLLSSPITRLTKSAQLISRGNLNVQTDVVGEDEFGTLGATFNLMTTQLRILVNELEDRVKARTQEIETQNVVLTTRARQLQTVAEVARQIVSVQELEPLLDSVTHLVSERFGFYHVGIFLLDENKEFALLRAANSEGGKRMLARKHMLPVGRVGIVGYATGTGKARIATDVGNDAVFFNNPDLPATRSEMALPLIVGNQVIGAIDIQSVESNSFHEDDIELFNTLADQVAIAIYNNQLYMETLRALNEAQSLHRQYLSNEWSQELSTRRMRGYVYNRSGITPQNVELPVWKTVLASGQPVVEQVAGKPGTPDELTMTVPIVVRGESIGVIHVQDQGEGHSWSQDEMTVVNNVANQVAVALENARLFENTVRRADREKKVLEITARIRSSNDPDRMMQIAVDELQRALGASRTQIYIRRRDNDAPAEKETPHSPNGNNGNH